MGNKVQISGYEASESRGGHEPRRGRGQECWDGWTGSAGGRRPTGMASLGAYVLDPVVSSGADVALLRSIARPAWSRCI